MPPAEPLDSVEPLVLWTVSVLHEEIAIVKSTLVKPDRLKGIQSPDQRYDKSPRIRIHTRDPVDQLHVFPFCASISTHTTSDTSCCVTGGAHKLSQTTHRPSSVVCLAFCHLVPCTISSGQLFANIEENFPSHLDPLRNQLVHSDACNGGHDR